MGAPTRHSGNRIVEGLRTLTPTHYAAHLNRVGQVR
jgi:hypothetical protein